jgi:predicted nuclease of predicted toxin-antitoxin system
MAALYADEHFPAPVVDQLRRFGHDVVTIQEDGHAGLKWPDKEVLQRATALRRAVLTLNRRDFIRLHRDNPNHSGIVATTQDLDFTRLAARIHEGIQAIGNLSGQVIRVYRPQS